jgi:tetrahydromethanopterin S-methyltransferase subunit F
MSANRVIDISRRVAIYSQDDLEAYGEQMAENARAESVSEVELARFSGFALGVVTATLCWLFLGLVLR